jgi:hypothetical protein
MANKFFSVLRRRSMAMIADWEEFFMPRRNFDCPGRERCGFGTDCGAINPGAKKMQEFRNFSITVGRFGLVVPPLGGFGEQPPEGGTPTQGY